MKEGNTMGFFSKVMWVGRATVFMVGLTVVLAVVLGIATTAVAATGGNFLLGKANGATKVSKLAAKIAGPTLSLVNSSTDPAATALNLTVAPGKAPLTVNDSAGKATNLDSDKLDGMDSSSFLGATQKAADSVHADNADHATNSSYADNADQAANAASANSAEDANTLDGRDSSDFLGAGQKATDSAHADNADNAASAESATSAKNAANLGNKPPSAYFSGATYTVSQAGVGSGDAVNRNYLEVTCDPGDVLLSGGYDASALAPLDQVLLSQMTRAQGTSGVLHGWRVGVRNYDGALPSFGVDAYCADFGATHQ